MRLELTGRHVEISPVLRRLVDRKLARLDRMLNDSALSAQVVLTSEKRGRRVDMTLHARGEKFLHGVAASGSWEASLSQAIDKIVQQAQRVKGKWQERKRGISKGTPIVGESREAARVRPAQPGRGPSGVAPQGRIRPRMPRILRASRQPLKAMSVSDAAREIDANGEGVVVFRDAETAAVSVLFRRADGELTLVETEA
jgi:putative sigma-54 modulation protein